MTDLESERDLIAEDEPGGRALGRFAAGLVCGVVLGAGLALLFAPERGDHTRRRLRRRLERMRADTADSITRADALRRELRRRRESR
jgi:gas vesicle protein